MNSREQDYRTKQEGDPSDTKFSKTPSTSRQWAGYRNPRIVRVSRTFGGKDRHSKVCTVRGLRDRRIRLSVPTAIQLYDLQDRLGLSQPSKVVDWLLDATKADIDKLPPLQLPPGDFSQFFQPLGGSHQQSSSPSQSSFPHFFNAGSTSSFLKEGGEIKINDQTMVERSRFFIPDAAHVTNRKRTDREEKDKWIASNEQEKQEELAGYAAQIQAQNFFPTANQPPFPSLLNHALPAYNPYYHLEPANLSLSQFGNHSFPIQAEEHSHMNYSSSMAPPASQFYLCPSAAALPTMIPSLPPFMPPAVESADPRQINHFQFLSSSSQNVLPNSLMPTLHLISSPMKSLTLNVNPKILPSEERNSNEQEKEGTGS